MKKSNSRIARGFSLLEVMMVVVIIGLLAAIAIPKFSRAAAGATDQSLTGDLAVLRNAIDMYQAEHSGTYPSATTINTQLTQYTDAAGAVSATKDATHIYGPYLKSVPAAPLGAKKGGTVIAAADGAGVGWIYSATNGTITANTTTETDASGALYSSY